VKGPLELKAEYIAQHIRPRLADTQAPLGVVE
jgi:hypothetical protein